MGIRSTSLQSLPILEDKVLSNDKSTTSGDFEATGGIGLSRDSSLDVFTLDESNADDRSSDDQSLSRSRKSTELNSAPPLSRSRKGSNPEAAFSSFSYTNYSVLGEIGSRRGSEAIHRAEREDK